MRRLTCEGQQLLSQVLRLQKSSALVLRMPDEIEPKAQML
jgi:hypothetical protein